MYTVFTFQAFCVYFPRFGRGFCTLVPFSNKTTCFPRRASDAKTALSCWIKKLRCNSPCPATFSAAPWNPWNMVKRAGRSSQVLEQGFDHVSSPGLSGVGIWPIHIFSDILWIPGRNTTHVYYYLVLRYTPDGSPLKWCLQLPIFITLLYIVLG